MRSDYLLRSTESENVKLEVNYYDIYEISS
jgi:hypothetical protein